VVEVVAEAKKAQGKPGRSVIDSYYLHGKEARS